MENKLTDADKAKIEQAKLRLLNTVLPQLKLMASSGVWGGHSMDVDDFFQIKENEREISISMTIGVDGVFRRKFYISTDIDSLNEDDYFTCGYSFYIDTQDSWIRSFLEKHNVDYEAMIIKMMAKIWCFSRLYFTEDDEIAGEIIGTKNSVGYIIVTIYNHNMLFQIFSNFISMALAAHAAVPLKIPNRPLTAEEKSLQDKLNNFLPELNLKKVDEDIEAINNSIKTVPSHCWYITSSNKDNQ